MSNMCDAFGQLLAVVEEQVRGLSSSAEAVRVLDKARADLKVLGSQSESIKWDETFRENIRCSMHLRMVNLTKEEKKKWGERQGGKCQACGCFEEMNHVAIDLGGCLWSQDDSRVGFGEHCADMLTVHKHHMHQQQFPLLLHPCDSGRYVVGSTCLRRAQLVHLCQIWLYELYCVTVDHLNDRRAQGLRVQKHKRYMLSYPEEITRWEESFSTLRSMVAEESSAPLLGHCVPNDSSFWDAIDRARTANYDTKDLPRVLTTRTKEAPAIREEIIADAREELLLPKKAKKRNPKQIASSSSEDSSSEEDSEAAPVSLRKSPRFACSEKQALLDLMTVQRYLTEQNNHAMGSLVAGAIATFYTKNLAL